MNPGQSTTVNGHLERHSDLCDILKLVQKPIRVLINSISINVDKKCSLKFSQFAERQVVQIYEHLASR